jgi:hypothetical protein
MLTDAARSWASPRSLKSHPSCNKTAIRAQQIIPVRFDFHIAVHFLLKMRYPQTQRFDEYVEAANDMPSCVKDEVVVFYRRNRKGLRVIWGASMLHFATIE